MPYVNIYATDKTLHEVVYVKDITGEETPDMFVFFMTHILRT